MGALRVSADFIFLQCLDALLRQQANRNGNHATLLYGLRGPIIQRAQFCMPGSLKVVIWRVKVEKNGYFEEMFSSCVLWHGVGKEGMFQELVYYQQL